MGLIEQDVNQLANNSDLLADDASYYSLRNDAFVNVMQPGY